MNIDLHRSRPRSCRARRVSTFDRAEVTRRLFAGQDVQDDFIIVTQLAYPSAETCFDVCTDGQNLYVSVLLLESMVGSGRGLPTAEEDGVGPNCVEVLICPHGDGVGFLQFGAGPGKEVWFNHFWPYRDGRVHLGARPVWEVDSRFDDMGEEAPSIVFFRFPLASIVGTDPGGTLGFNVMRTQITTGESAAWNYADGAGFPDASSCGVLYLETCENTQTALPSVQEAAPRLERGGTKKVQLQATYDFPDEMVGGTYTPDVLRAELRKLHQNGFGRIYWIDYPHWVNETRKLKADPAADSQLPGPWRRITENFHRTVQAFGGDPMPVCARMAHEEGLEFFTVMKPYDSGNFIQPDFSFSRNPGWCRTESSLPGGTMSLFADNDAPLSFAVPEVRLFGSYDNESYSPCPDAKITEKVVCRPRYVWTPAGKQRTSGEERVRCIQVEGIKAKWKYLALQFPSAEESGHFGNQNYLLVEAGDTVFSLSHRTRTADFRAGGFDFENTGASAGWADCSEGIEMRYKLPAGRVVGIRVGCSATLTSMPDPSFAPVRDFWVSNWVQRAINAGADGVDVRVAFHTECNEWLALAYAAPVLEEFRRLVGRDPQACPQDYQRVRRIRGGFHTDFLRQASKMLQSSGKKLEAHVEARMKASPEHDTYAQIHWDYATWIDQRIIDGVNLKYLGPFNPFVEKEILPRARRQEIPVHVIAAIGQVQTQPRTPEWAQEKLAMIQAAGLQGLNLYEMWSYLRTTPQGQPISRGCARAVFARLHQQQQSSQ